MASSPSSIAGRKVRFRPARNYCRKFGAANFRSRSKRKRPAIWFRISLFVARLFVRSASSLDGRATKWLGPYLTDRHSDFSDGVGVGRGLLCLRAARIASGDLDETNAAS